MIAVDWGTSSFRAYRVDADGAVVDQRSAAAGLLSCNGEFESVLVGQLQGWDDPVILMAGMVGSRSGWREAPYADCPAGIAEIAAGLVDVDAPALAASGRRVLIVPGVRQRGDDAQPEVMRGEETQILGLAETLPGPGPHTLCLPGTHSKWVVLQAGRIVTLRTAMTGEVYALMRRHSLLAASMPPDAAVDVDNVESFALGVAEAGRCGGLLNHLFGVRTRGLFGTLAVAAAPSWLSGLLIGHELRDLLPAGCPHVHLIGSTALVGRYERALAIRGVASTSHGESTTVRGLFRLARAGGLAD